MNKNFSLNRDKWLLTLKKRRDSARRIKPKISLIKSRQKRLQQVQRTLNNDIAKLKAEIIQLEQYIPLLDEFVETVKPVVFGGVK